jgi:hypothetical protein
VVARSPVVSSVFYGYPAELVAQWCGVTVRTAERWKRGERRPSTSAVELFELYRARRVLGSEWNGWLVKDALLVDPEGNETSQAQLRAYYLVYQLVGELRRHDAEAAAAFERIMRAAG